MRLYHSLPATDYSWATRSILSLRQLRGPKQSAVNQIVVARVELARLVVFAVIELGVHIAAAAVKTVAATIQCPYDRFSEVSPHAWRLSTLAPI